MTELPILSMEAVESAYYLRMNALDRPGVLADISRILAELGISIEAIRQREPGEGEQHVPVVILTQRVVERSVNEAIQRIQELSSIQGEVVLLRMETLS